MLNKLCRICLYSGVLTSVVGEKVVSDAISPISESDVEYSDDSSSRFGRTPQPPLLLQLGLLEDDVEEYSESYPDDEDSCFVYGVFGVCLLQNFFQSFDSLDGKIGIWFSRVQGNVTIYVWRYL